MSNGNLSILGTSNTFQDWLINTNNLANAINQLRNGLFYADNGSITLANGTFLILTNTGTVLSVSGNVTLSQQLTTGSIQNQGNLVSVGNSVSFPTNTVLVQVANTVQSPNVISTGILTAQNVNVAGYVAFTGNNLANTPAITIPFFNQKATINVGNSLFISNTGNIYVSQNAWINNANVTLLGVTTYNLGTGLLNTMNVTNQINLDANNTWNIGPGGNANLGTIVATGGMLVEGSAVFQANLSTVSNTFILRFGQFSDDSSHILMERTSTEFADIMFNNVANTFQVAANSAQSYNTIVTTDGNNILGIGGIAFGNVGNNGAIANTTAFNAGQSIYTLGFNIFSANNSGGNTYYKIASVPASNASMIIEGIFNDTYTTSSGYRVLIGPGTTISWNSIGSQRSNAFIAVYQEANSALSVYAGVTNGNAYATFDIKFGSQITVYTNPVGNTAPSGISLLTTSFLTNQNYPDYWTDDTGGFHISGAVQANSSPLSNSVTRVTTAIAGVQSVTQNWTSNTTMTPIQGLTVNLNENGIYEMRGALYIQYSANNAGGWKLDFASGNAGTTASSSYWIYDGNLHDVEFGMSTQIQNNSDPPTFMVVMLFGGIVSVVTKGTFGPRFGQLISAANTLIVNANSYIVLTKVG